jgi:hypothetical protein
MISSSGIVARQLNVVEAEPAVGDVAAVRPVVFRRVGVDVDQERFRETYTGSID